MSGTLDTLPRREARRAYNKLMEARPRRIEVLRRLLQANGVGLGITDAAMQDLNDWFRSNVEEGPDSPGRLLPEWYSVVNDIALFLGDVMITRHSHLRWEFFTWGKKNVSYQRHVIMGFTQVSNPKINEDLDWLIAVYGHCIIDGQDVEDDMFLRTLRQVDEIA